MLCWLSAGWASHSLGPGPNLLAEYPELKVGCFRTLFLGYHSQVLQFVPSLPPQPGAHAQEQQQPMTETYLLHNKAPDHSYAVWLQCDSVVLLLLLHA